MVDTQRVAKSYIFSFLLIKAEIRHNLAKRTIIMRIFLSQITELFFDGLNTGEDPAI
jgi:hypothetical protein